MKFQQYQYLKKNLFPFDEHSVLNNRYKNEDINPKLLNPLVIAYIGDAYYHLYVRTRLLDFEQSHVHLLNDISMQIVSATFQVQAYEAIKNELTETENYIFLPTFGVPMDQEAIETAGQLFQKAIVPVRVPEIAQDGGALNCISWES